MPSCPVCHMPVDASDLFCRHCGGLSAEASGAERIECSNHPGQLAVAACIVCGKPVCGDCAVRSAGKFFCEDPEHCTIRNGWQPIYSCTSEFEADIVERNLQHAGLHIRVFSTGSHLELYWAHWKPIVSVWAARAKAAEAEALLRQLGLIGDADFSLPPSEDTFQ